MIFDACSTRLLATFSRVALLFFSEFEINPFLRSRPVRYGCRGHDLFTHSATARLEFVTSILSQCRKQYRLIHCFAVSTCNSLSLCPKSSLPFIWLRGDGLTRPSDALLAYGFYFAAAFPTCQSLAISHRQGCTLRPVQAPDPHARSAFTRRFARNVSHTPPWVPVSKSHSPRAASTVCVLHEGLSVGRTHDAPTSTFARRNRTGPLQQEIEPRFGLSAWSRVPVTDRARASAPRDICPVCGPMEKSPADRTAKGASRQNEQNTTGGADGPNCTDDLGGTNPMLCCLSYASICTFAA